MNNRNIWLQSLGCVDADAAQVDLFESQDMVVEDAEDTQDVEQD